VVGTGGNAGTGTSTVSGPDGTSGGSGTTTGGNASSSDQRSATPKSRSGVAGVSATHRGRSFPHGVLSSTSLAPSASKLPFLVLALLSLATILLAIGVIPARYARHHPALARTLAEKQTDLAFVGGIIFTAAVVAYLLT
jgi:hypothetical protein